MRTVATFSVLLILAGLSLWWLLSLQAARQLDTDTLINAPKLIVQIISATRFDHQGVRQYELSAQALTQWPDQRGVDIEHPRMQTYQNGEQLQWRMAATTGWLADDNSLLRLSDAIYAQRLSDDPSQQLQLNTDNLNYYVAAQTLETDAEVRLTTRHGELQGRGLYGQLTQRYFELHSDVRGQYVVPEK